MKSGFEYPFKAPKQYSKYERCADGLVRDLRKLDGIAVDDRASLIRLNSTYLDMIDRWYTIRGGVDTILMAVLAPGIIFLMVVFLFVVIIPYLISGGGYLIGAFSILSLGALSWIIFLWRSLLLGKSFLVSLTFRFDSIEKQE
ncbi:hypothetical protein [Burkholderia ubonensis]|uniref:hypothetical protein n=1 Tax=Burkholderia ubonensis TaxID=101571 RepID=UPI0012F93283|nr:hypothetical protein [Burkholderia ubonensis]